MSEAIAADVVDVRRQIMAVATTLFANNGYGSTSVRQIVEGAGVTKPTLYYYFENKEALFLEIIRTHIAGLEAFSNAIAEAPGTVRDRLLAFAEQYVQGAEANKDVVKLLMTARHSAAKQPEVDMMSMHMRAIEQLHRVFEEGKSSGELRPDIDTGVAVMSFIGTVNLMSAACVEGMPRPAGATEKFIDIFFSGVGQ